LATDYRHYVLARAFQGLGYGFFFVSANIIAYSQLRPHQNNRASSLTNFFRNWGGSFGIALMTTVAERRQQFHQTNVGAAISATSQQFAERTRVL
jgi:DHA2 family multidrug resistance protein